MFACDTATSPELNTPTPDFGKGRVIQSVTGSAHITSGGQLRTLSFTARRHADGTVSGEWQRFTRNLGSLAHGDITCFTIIGNQAWLGGVVERTTTVPGGVFWTVVDNGEGANAAPDQLSLQNVGLSPATVAFFCATTPPRALIPIEAGNIQVRP